MPTVELTYIPNHAELSLAELAQQYVGKPLAEGVAIGVGERAQTVEDALWAIYSQMGISPTAFGGTVAEGAQLDAIGKLIQFPRQGLIDADYITLLRVYVRILVSSGTVEQILAMFKILYPTNLITLTEEFPAAFTLSIYDTPITDAQATILIQIIRKAKGGGIDGQFLYTPAAQSATFTFDGTMAQAFDNGAWSGALE